MENAILEMQQNLKDGWYIAFVSANEDKNCPVTKADNLDFLDDKTVVIRRKNGWNSIINLNLIVAIDMRRGLS